MNKKGLKIFLILTVIFFGLIGLSLAISDYRINKYGTSSIVQWVGYSKEENRKKAEEIRKVKYRKVGAKYRQWKEN